MAVSNDNNEDDFSDQSADWGDADEIDSYMNIHKPTQDISSTSNRDKESNEWICHQCNYPNTRQVLIFQNGFKCIKCNAQLNLEQQSNQSIELINETKNDDDEVNTKTHNRHSIYKHNKETNANIKIDEELALQLIHTDIDSTETHIDMHKYKQIKYDMNLDTQYRKPMPLTQTITNTINQQNNENK
eukprot:40839_1